MATRIDWDELFPPLPEPGRRRIDLSSMPGARTRGEVTRIDLGNVGDINQSNAVNRAAKGDMPADIVADLLAGQSDEEQALRELGPIDALARSLEIPPRMENYQRGQNSLRTAEDILSMIPGPGNVIAARDAFQGAQDAGEAFGGGDTRGGLLNAALAALSGVGAVVGLPTSRLARDAARGGSRTARIFAGPEAKTADLDALRRAEEMKWGRSSPEDIWRETGWAWDEPRGQSYFEIDDSLARMLPGQAQNVGQAIDHPALFDAYPDMAAMRFSPESQPANSGAYFRGGEGTPERIALGPMVENKRLGLMLHELQHGVQKREAFAPGASTSGYMNERNIGRDQARRLYERTAGEVQARNSEARLGMTAAERRATPPWATQDTDPSDVYYPSTLHERQDVLIPAPAGRARDRALEMRDAGKSNPEVFADTRRFFGPEGQPMMEISDRGMSVDTSPFQPGDRATFGDLIDHPALFGVRPELASVPIDFTDKFVTQQGVRGGVARRGPNQASEITLGERPEWYREQIPKLLQYKIAEDSGLASALRHDLVDMIPEYQRAVAVAREIADNPRPGDDMEAALNYLAKVEPWRDRLENALATREGQRTALKEATRTNAGNANARIVRGRAVAPDDVMRAWGPYPYAQGMPSFEKVIALPQENLTREQIAEFLANWQNFGAGAGR